MQNEKPRFEGQILSKKTKPKDEESSRKQQKSTKRKKNALDEEKEQKLIKQQSINNVLDIQKLQNEENTQILKDLCSLLFAYKPSTIKNVLEKNNYDKQKAMDTLLNYSPDNEINDYLNEKKKIECLQKQDLNDKIGAVSQNANNLMIEVFETLMKEQINWNQFEELYQEIAKRIKMDQKLKGVGMYEINNFVDECNSIKQILLTDFKEQLIKFEDFQFYQNYELYNKTRKFRQQKFQKQIMENKINQEDFPLLQKEVGQNYGIYRNYYQQKKKKESQSLFISNRNNLPWFSRERNKQYSIFNVDNTLSSQKDLQTLHKQFPDIPILDLKFIYITFDKNINTSKQFIFKNYHQKQIRVVQTKSIHSSPPKINKKAIYSSQLSNEVMDQQLRHLSLQEIRKQINHLYKLKQTLQITKINIKGSRYTQQLYKIINQKAPIIRKLSQASKLLLVDQMAVKNPLYVDLHGYREQEICPLLDRIAEMIKVQFYKGNEQIRIQKIKDRSTACLIVMTGKGLHSRGNTGILKPKVAQWCETKGIDCQQKEDHIKVYVTID